MVRFGLIGTSTITEHFLDAGREHPEFVASAVYSRTKEKGAAFAQKMSIPMVYTSLEKMAESGQIDAVYIASPNSLHCEQALYFIEKRIPTLIEKPIALNSAEVERIVEAARENNVLQITALRNMFEPRLIAARKALSEIGPIRHIGASYCQYSSRYDALKSGIVENAFRPDMGGGAAMDLGIYVIGPTVHQFGMPETLSITGKKLFTGVDGQGTITLGYPSLDATLSFAKTFPAEKRAEICGEDGCMYIYADPNSRVAIEYRDGTGKEIGYTQEKKSMYYEVEEFIRCFQNNEKESSLWTWQDDIMAQKVIDLYRKQVGVVYPSDR